MDLENLRVGGQRNLSVGVVAASQWETFTNATLLAEFGHNLWPDAILRLVHQGCIADQIHAMPGT